MAEPETLAALAAQLDELRGQAEAVRRTVTQWDARLETEGIGATMLLRLEVRRLAEQLAEAVSKNRLAPPAAPWWLGLSPDERGQQLAELRDWVDRFARVQYPGYLARLPPCWPNHPEALWELANLKTEWLRVYADEDNRDLSGALWWHERWLPGTLARLKDAIRCDASGCHTIRPRRYGNE
jgi:hypothetical protein